MKLYQNRSNHHQIVAIRWNGRIKTFTNDYPMVSKKYTPKELKHIKQQRHLKHLKQQHQLKKQRQAMSPLDKAGLKLISTIMKQHPTITDMGWNGRYLNYKSNNSVYPFGQSSPQQTKLVETKERQVAYHQYISDRTTHYYRLTKHHNLILYANTFTQVAHLGDYIVMSANELQELTAFDGKLDTPNLVVFSAKAFQHRYQAVQSHTIPKYLYVITQDTGEYSDRDITVVRVVNNVLKAHQITMQLNHKYDCDDFSYDVVPTTHNDIEE